MAQDATRLVWIDMEMTGLDPDSDRILEVATVITTSHLDIVAEGPVLVVHQSDAVLAGMDACLSKPFSPSALARAIDALTSSTPETVEAA